MALANEGGALLHFGDGISGLSMEVNVGHGDDDDDDGDEDCGSSEGVMEVSETTSGACWGVKPDLTTRTMRKMKNKERKMSLRLTGNWVVLELDLIFCVFYVFEFWSKREERTRMGRFW